MASAYAAKLEDFLSSKYRKDLEKLAEEFPVKRSFYVDYSELDRHDAEIADELIKKPYEIIEATQEAISQMGLATVDGTEFSPHVRFFNLPKEKSILVRNINSEHINTFLSAEGVITKITEVRPKMMTASFECRHCGRIYNLEQKDQMGKLVEPAICTCERKNFQLSLDNSIFVDTQIAEIQEPIEILRGGEQAKKMIVWLQDDLTNQFIPGDKIEITGVLRLKTPKTHGAIYDKFVDSNNIVKLEREFEEIELGKDDLEQIKRLASDPRIYEKIVESIAPSIYGHKEIKEAIAMQLFGGTPGKQKPDGMKIRPDMHILLVGDPGTAKTQLLRYVKDLAPKGIYVSGKSSSGAGLTASAEKDELAEGGWTLKAGALVLASGGIALIDEFDKMGDEDRSSMHEAMESQTISVAKAGMITTFKANTAILAAANPKYGRFDAYTQASEQFNIPVTIMSRFDLIFPIRDVLDEVRDKEMADHILIAHQVAGARLTKGYDKKAVEEAEKRILPTINSDLLRKYIAFARRETKPALTNEAMDKLKEFYLDLRKLSEKQQAMAITARYLEALVRLSEASAKGRLSQKVEIEDSERAIRLLKFCFREFGSDPETGKIDVDILATGTTKSRMDKMRTVFRIIKRLSGQYDEVQHEMILEEAKAGGVKPEDLDEILATLKRNGEIYSPRYGIYKPSEEK